MIARTFKRIGAGLAAGVLGLLLMVAPARAQIGRVSPGGMAIILAKPGVAFMGDAHAPVTVVVFMDYNCPYCRIMAPDLVKLTEANPRVRVLYKELPIFGPVSDYAAHAAIACNWQGKYIPAYRAMISTHQKLTSIADVRGALKTAHVDLAQMDRDLKAHQAEIDALIARNRSEAAALGLKGTPGMIVGDLLFQGSLSYGELDKFVADQDR
ncbi:MAG TPA: DsbA family protein [Caulobacteraceae bacterium]